MTHSLKRTVLNSNHQNLGASLVNFAGWEMPLHYGSQINEHMAVRNAAGIFDVSHMRPIAVEGEQALAFLQKVVCSDLQKRHRGLPGSAIYTCMVHEKGGVIDDLIVYVFSEQLCWVVVNASRFDEDYGWLKQHSKKFAVKINHLQNHGIIAVQGPKALELFKQSNPDLNHLTEQLAKRFTVTCQNGSLLARTGYTGEDGYEFIADNEQIVKVWQNCIEAGVVPCGLGARDTLRLESGLMLYGNDLDGNHSPLESGVAWVVDKDKAGDFVGKEYLQQQQTEINIKGIVLMDRGIIRQGQKVTFEGRKSSVTSGAFSPVLKRSVALVRLPKKAKGECLVEIRGKQLKAKIVPLPFVKSGKANFEL